MKRLQKPNSTKWGLAVTVDIVIAGLFLGLFFFTHTLALLIVSALLLVIGIPLAVVYRTLQMREQRSQ